MIFYLFFCSALAAFYTRNFAEKITDIKPPLLQVASCAYGFVYSYKCLLIFISSYSPGGQSKGERLLLEVAPSFSFSRIVVQRNCRSDEEVNTHASFLN